MKILALALCLAVGLAACGDDASSDRRDHALDEMLGRNEQGPPTLFPGGSAPSIPGAPTPAAYLEKLGTIELTDEMMEGYVTILQGMRGRERRTPAGALLDAHGLDMQRWALITAVIGRAHLTGGRSTQIESLEKRLADAQARRAGASTTQRQILDIQIQGYEAQLARLRETPEATDVDRGNQAVLERWKARIEAATRAE